VYFYDPHLITKVHQVVNKELAEMLITGSDPSGTIVSTYNGLGMPISLKISESAMSLGAEALSVASSQAMVDGFQKAQTTMMSRMQALYAGAGIPGQ
jgi:DNA-binding protein YbaB